MSASEGVDGRHKCPSWVGHMHCNNNVGCLPDSGRKRAALQAPHEGIANAAVIVSYDDDKPGRQARLDSLWAVVQAVGSSSQAAMQSASGEGGSRGHEASRKIPSCVR